MMRVISLALLLGAARALLVPQPHGPYSVAVKAFELIDPSRKDLLAPTNNNTVRRTMASVYLPVEAEYRCGTERVSYMPALTASVYDQVAAALAPGISNNFFEQFRMDNCNISSINVAAKPQEKQFPVAIFSPGLTASRLLYAALARSLASRGYIIFSLDHAYETTVVEFPDGQVANGFIITQTNESMYPVLLKQRVGDERFLISQLSNKTFTDAIFQNFPGTFDGSKAAVYGHSFGGPTAAITVQQEPKAIGGLNIDGTLFGEIVKATVKGKPFVFVESSEHIDSPPSTLAWDVFYRNLDAAKMKLAVKHTKHYAFLDLPLLLTVDPVPPASQSAVDGLLGTLNGTEVERAENDFMGGFLELLFHGDPEPLKNVDKDPNIEIVASSLKQ